MSEEKPKSKKMLVIIVALLLVLILVIGGVAAVLLLSGGGSSPEHEAEVAHEKEEPKKKDKKKKKKEHEAAPVFEKLEVFTVNLAGENNEMLQTEINVELLDEKEKEKLKSYMPKIRNNVILLLSSKQAVDLKTAEGKKKLIDELKATINEAMGADDDEGVQSVTLSSFILQ
ncbi:flagellar FliL protein [Chitinivorax tropicus]|uniref:Flagellar protein FliL n=1 Tax=Chitinivorax tropicus TaxID=714531 RepID=A0A840MSR2_9PROT|nr:flagellar basal body-associated FliL family protein [Chitinivorax tropicus]MBB5020455.1 flagellar FliL protein [Chitinivorax tropicus]